LEEGQQRRKYINQRSKTRVAVVDVERRDWCRTQDCVARGIGPCSGEVVPHHAGKNPGRGMKAPEFTVVPICWGHHEDITGKWDGYGVFQHLGEAGRRALQDDWIGETQARYLSAGSRRSR
jgi:hypothetical protein